MKHHLTIILPALALTSCVTGCATIPPSTVGLTKDEIKERAAVRLEAREVRNDRWARIGEAAGAMAINIGGTWLKAWLTKDDGFKK